MQEKSGFASVRMPVIYCRSDVEMAQGGCANAVLVQTQKTTCAWAVLSALNTYDSSFQLWSHSKCVSKVVADKLPYPQYR